MPRPMLRTPDSVEKETNTLFIRPSEQQQSSAKSNLEQHQYMQLMRKKRSKDYLNAITQLDAGGKVQNKAKFDELINAIQKELPEVFISGGLLGFVSKCYLGKPYEVHSVDMTGEIIEHYPYGTAMPNGLEKARGLALRGNYEFIEVYTTHCCAVSSDGSVAVIID